MKINPHNVLNYIVSVYVYIKCWPFAGLFELLFLANFERKL